MIKTKSIPSLTRAEEDIMQIVWQLELCLVRDIMNHLGQPDIPHSTISSVVRILEKKGFVTHKSYGKTHEYRPLISKEDYALSNVNGLIRKYFGNSQGALLNFLVQKNSLELNEVNQVLKLLRKTKKK